MTPNAPCRAIVKSVVPGDFCCCSLVYSYRMLSHYSGCSVSGNLMRVSGVVERLSDTTQNALINIVTIVLGLSVGSKLIADKFLQPQTLGILILGVIAFESVQVAVY